MSTCSICLYRPDPPTMVLPCKHMFCHSCINQWQVTNNTCPCCRTTMRQFKFVQRVTDFQNRLQNLIAGLLVMFSITCVVFLAVELLSTNQPDKTETGLASSESSPGLIDYLQYTIMKDFLFTTLYYIYIPFYYTGWVIWFIVYYIFMMLYTLVTCIFGFITFLFNWLWCEVCSFCNLVAAYPFKQLLQPSFDLMLILLYVLWDGVTDVVYVVFEMLAITISQMKNIIVIISITLCIIIYKFVTNLISVLGVMVLSVTDLGLAVLPFFMCLLLIFVVLVVCEYLLSKR